MLKFLTYVGIAICSLIGLIGTAIGILLLSVPHPKDIQSCLTTKMYHVHLCPTDPGYVKFADISPAARNAVIVSEDAAFYDHNGFDWAELRMSLETNLEKGGFARGGSTITQQLAKNVYLTSEKSLIRKLKEAIITVQLEDRLSKNEILEKYLNVVEFGPNLYGIGKASRFYFGKPPSQLTAAEGAFLAFLLPNPKKYSVSYRKKQLTKFARSQTREIVNRLYRFKKISEAEHEEALGQLDYLFGGQPPPAAEAAPSGDVEPSPEEAGPPDEAPAEDTSTSEVSPE